MQSTPQLPECPPLVAESIDHILRRGVGNPEGLTSPGFRASIGAATEEPIRNGTPQSIFADGEKPVYRLICYMSLGGKTNKEIADEMDMSVATIGNILRQPASKDFMAREARRIAGGEVENMFKTQLGQTFTTLIELRDSAQTPPATRATVCATILDRAFGKPTTYVKSESTISYDEAKSELVEIDRQLAALKQQTKVVPGGS